MGNEIDYNAVVADLEAKRSAIDTAIAAMRQMMNLGADQQSPPSNYRNACKAKS